MTLRLTAHEDEALTRLAAANRVSKNSAVAAAIDIATPRTSHPEFVGAATTRLLRRYALLIARLTEV